MRFIDFLRAAVLLSAATGTALAIVTVVSAGGSADDVLLLALVGWWLVAGFAGAVLSRRAEARPPVERLLATARSTTSLPEVRPSSVLLGRLWPLLVLTGAAGLLALAGPQIPGIATGFTILFALLWRRQDAAVAAIEDRDGVAFYVESGSPFKPMTLLRTPGFRSTTPMSVPDGAA